MNPSGRFGSIYKFRTWLEIKKSVTDSKWEILDEESICIIKVGF